MSTARVPLPDAALAPGVRDFIRRPSQFSLREVVPGWGLIAPAEGAGTTRNYLTAHRLCDAQSTITDETWAPLVANPPIEGPTRALIGLDGCGSPQVRRSNQWQSGPSFESEEAASGLALGLASALLRCVGRCGNRGRRKASRAHRP
jgi:hypothetical protein